jgi:hypothetical protein
MGGGQTSLFLPHTQVAVCSPGGIKLPRIANVLERSRESLRCEFKTQPKLLFSLQEKKKL